MTNDTNNNAANHELSIDELDAAAGGFWKELGVAMGAGGVTGGMGGRRHRRCTGCHWRRASRWYRLLHQRVVLS